MYACGLRIGEATTLEVTAVDGANRVLRIIGKGDKERRVPLPQPVLDDLRSLWRTHCNPRWLFPNHSGTKPVTQHVVCRTFRAAAQAAKELGIAEGTVCTRLAAAIELLRARVAHWPKSQRDT